jgi:hypothetical protein
MNEAMTAALKKLAEATNNEIYDPEWHGGEWMVEAVETHETIEQFIEGSSHWTEARGMGTGSIAGLPFVAWKSAQARKGQQREALSVVDFGEVRYAIRMDLRNFK